MECFISGEQSGFTKAESITIISIVRGVFVRGPAQVEQLKNPSETFANFSNDCYYKTTNNRGLNLEKNANQL